MMKTGGAIVAARMLAPGAFALFCAIGAIGMASAQTLRPTLCAAPATPKERVMVSVAGFAAASLMALAPPTTKFQAGRRADYEAMVSVHAKANDVPETLVHRIIVRESKYQPNLVGRGGTIGMMQIKLATARGMGYVGTAEELRDPQVNLRWGVKYLAGAWRAAHGDADLAVRKYAAGYYEPRGRTAAAAR